MTSPYAPPLLAVPIINPSIGGYGQAVPYISPSQWQNAPTGLDISNLIEGGDDAAQLQSLVDTIRAACGRADRYCFGPDPSAKGASLCATSSVEQAFVKPLQGELRLLCDYKPVLELTGLSTGSSVADQKTIDTNAAGLVNILGKVLHVPVWALGAGLTTAFPTRISSRSGRVLAIWSYVSGYPHTMLTAEVDVGDQVLPLFATGPGSSMLGMYAGTQLDIVDGERTETVALTATPTSNTVACTPLLYEHTLPTAPDFIPVTALPDDVRRGAIFWTNSLIKERGSGGFALAEEGEPSEAKTQMARDATDDLAMAMDCFDDYRVASKTKS